MNLNVETIQIKRGAWNSLKDYIPKRGELVYCLDDRDAVDNIIVIGPSVKLGNGSSKFSDLPFMNYGPIFTLIKRTCEQIVEQMLADAYEPTVIGNELSFDSKAAVVSDRTITLNELVGVTVQDNTLFILRNA